MKKTLSLVLVLAMVFSLFGFASAANYPDADEIQYEEEVAVLSGLGIVNGKDTGFEPKDNLTRAEAAKMVAYMIKTPDIAAQLPVDNSKFVDVTAAHDWANPSIVLLEHEGIINGKSADTFAPNDKVTGYELAKMLLVAIGYGKQGEYVGDGWHLRVTADALREGIFDGDLDGKYNEALTREEAALYIFNAMKVDRVHLCKHDRYAVNDYDCDCGFHTEDVGPFGEAVYGLKSEYDEDCYGRPATVWTSFGDPIAYIPDAPVAAYDRAVSADELYDLLGAEAVLYAGRSNMVTAVAQGNGFYQNLKGGEDGNFNWNNGNVLKTNIEIDDFATKYDADDEEKSYIGGQGVVTEIYAGQVENGYRVITVIPALLVVTEANEVAATRSEGAHVDYKFAHVDENGEAVSTIKEIEVTDYTTVVKPSQDRDTVEFTAPVKVGDYVMAYGPATVACPLQVSPATIIEGTVTKYTNRDFTYTIDEKEYPMSAAINSYMVDDEDFNVERIYIIDTEGNLVLGLDKPAPATEFAYVIGARTAEVLDTKYNEMTSVAMVTFVTEDGEVVEVPMSSVYEDGAAKATLATDGDDASHNKYVDAMVNYIDGITEDSATAKASVNAALAVITKVGEEDYSVNVVAKELDEILDANTKKTYVPTTVSISNVYDVINNNEKLGSKLLANDNTVYYNVIAKNAKGDEKLVERTVVETYEGMKNVPTMLPVKSAFAVDFDGDKFADLVYMYNAVEKVDIDNVFVIDARDEFGTHDYEGGTYAVYDVIVEGEETTMMLMDQVAGTRLATGMYDVRNSYPQSAAGYKDGVKLSYNAGVLTVDGATEVVDYEVPVYIIDAAHGTCETVAVKDLAPITGRTEIIKDGNGDGDNSIVAIYIVK